eukprot:jgi/Botrbrau1/8494/Bobra.0029s0002.1
MALRAQRQQPAHPVGPRSSCTSRDAWCVSAGSARRNIEASWRKAVDPGVGSQPYNAPDPCNVQFDN